MRVDLREYELKNQKEIPTKKELVWDNVLAAMDAMKEALN
jgi:hypothetical protein